MNEIARDKVAARNEARALADEDLAPMHSHHLLRAEAIEAEAIERLDAQGEHELAILIAAEMRSIQASHARLTVLAMRAGAKISVRGGQR